MFSKTKFNFVRKCFATSLKEKKENLIKSKTLEKVIKENKVKITEDELEAIMVKFNFHKIIGKIGFFFLVAPTIYYFYREIKLAKNSKELTDVYNSSLNFIMIGNSLYVRRSNINYS